VVWFGEYPFGVLAPVIGNECMDMTMVDVSHVDAKEGDEVIISEKNCDRERCSKY